MIGERIKELREEKGLTQSEFSQTFGIKISTLASYETGAREPKIDMILRFAEYFGVTTDYLIGNSQFRDEDTYNIFQGQLTEWQQCLNRMSPTDQSTVLTTLTAIFNADDTDKHEKTKIRQKLFALMHEVRQFVSYYHMAKAQILSCFDISTNDLKLMEDSTKDSAELMAQALLAGMKNAANRLNPYDAAKLTTSFFDYVSQDLCSMLYKSIMELKMEMCKGIDVFATSNTQMTPVYEEWFEGDNDGNSKKD